MHGDKVEQFSGRVLSEVERLIEMQDGGSHAAYLKVWDLLQVENRKMGELFNNPRRSVALSMLAGWRADGLLTEAELQLFGEETQGVVALLCGE